MMRQRLWNAQRRAAPWMFLAPFVAVFAVFMLYPLYRSVALSLHQSVGPQSQHFVGLEHYRFFLHDQLFWLAVLNTAAYTSAFLAVQIPASLGLALALNSRRLRCRNAYRFAFFSTHLVGYAFVAIIFMLLMAQRHGAVATALGRIRPAWSEINWLGDPLLARATLVLSGLWLMTGWGMIYFLAALQSVDRQLYEAAQVDGAGKWSCFWHITLPGIRPVLSFLVIAGTIAGFQLFELPYILFQGPGPSWSGLTVVMYLYQNGFEVGDIGAASAIGWLLVGMILLVSLAQVRIMRFGRERP